jgi:Leucine-rich repeat (LRR) protein
MNETSQRTTAKVEVLTLHWALFDVSIIQDLEHLRILDLRDVHIIGSLEKFPKKLRVLSVHISDSSKDGGILEAIGTLVSVRYLKMSYSYWTSFPQSFGQMRALESLELVWCNDLLGLPDTICQFQALTELRITSCGQLKALPEDIGRLRALRYFKIDDYRLETLPESFGQLGALRRLELSCEGLRSLPESFGQLGALRRLVLEGCKKLRSLPRSFGNLRALEHLRIEECPCADELSISAGEFPVLRHLEIQYKGISNADTKWLL